MVLAFLKDVHQLPLKRSIPDAVKLRMQRKAEAKLIAHHKAINKHWKGVSYWTDADEVNQENDDENPDRQ